MTSSEPAVDAVARRGAEWNAVPVSLMGAGDRRLEAHTYLADGFGVRKRIEASGTGYMRVHEIAEVWQPSRLKGFVVPQGKGLPFLSAGQVFEARPRVRKWIAAAMVKDAQRREVDRSWLLLSCSGEVGRLTAVYDEHVGKVVTHDLLRIVPRSADDYGWLYAYFRSPTFYSIARASQYGHMIKHLEPAHVLDMPVVMPDSSVRDHVGGLARRALKLRREARAMQAQADREYEALVNPRHEAVGDALWQEVSALALSGGRRRLEGEYYRSDYVTIEGMVREAATAGVDTVSSVAKSIALGSRFRRYFGANGTPYRSASELFDVNAPVTKRIYSALLEHPDRYMLEPGQIVMACSGQTYGLLGRTMVLTERHRGVFGSHDLIRIDPDPAKVRTGYLQTVLSHEGFGRPLTIRHASGTSIPHLDPVDIGEVPVPRFDERDEARVADLCEEAIKLAAEADDLEAEATSAADAVAIAASR